MTGGKAKAARLLAFSRNGEKTGFHLGWNKLFEVGFRVYENHRHKHWLMTLRDKCVGRYDDSLVMIIVPLIISLNSWSNDDNKDWVINQRAIYETTKVSSCNRHHFTLKETKHASNTDRTYCK